MRWTQWVAWIGACIATAATVTCVVAVDRLARLELSYETRPYTIEALQAGPDAGEGHVRVGMATLRPGQEAVFEFCSADGLPPAWRDQATVRLHKDGETVIGVPLDADSLERASRNSDGACLLIGSGPIKFEGLYAIDVDYLPTLPAALREVPVRVRILGRPPLGEASARHVMVLAFGILLVLVGLLFQPRAPDLVGDPARQGRRLLGGAIAVGGLALGSQLVLPGSTLAVVKGVLMFALQVAVPALLCRKLGRGPVLQQLGLNRPRSPLVQVPVALALGFLLVHGARLSLRLVPRTGEAPIETFLSWPSGMLAFGALGVLLPLAEEVLFRGYLYRLALPLGRWAAGGISLVIFVAMHAQQAYGNWGALASIAMTGTAMTALRMWSGSAALPALAHVLYNFMLTMASF